MAIRYGCALIQQKKADEALEVFRKAAERDPRNALSTYLQAAAMPRKENPEESLALVAGANSSGNRITFPHPLWISSFPTNGACYQDLRRHIVDQCCEPLRQYARAVLSLADTQIRRGQYQNWDAWLEALQQMGDHIALQSESGTIQAITGLQIERDALRLRHLLHSAENAPSNAGLKETQERVEAAIAAMEKFEAGRDAAITIRPYTVRIPKVAVAQEFLSAVPVLPVGRCDGPVRSSPSHALDHTAPVAGVAYTLRRLRCLPGLARAGAFPQ